MFRLSLVLHCFILLLLGCSSGPRTADKTAPVLGVAQQPDADQFLIVDCLLPGETRQIGMQFSYFTQREPIKTSAFECAVRGGEFVSYDRANLATSVRIWSAKAEAGDAEAQVYTGEIYAKGLGVAPDYKIAADWYRKAAAQDNKRAQMNLGYLYEKGLGVEKNLAEAMSWYQKASGLDKLGIPYAATVNTTPKNEESEQIKLLKNDLNNNRSETEALMKQLEDKQLQLKESLEKKEALNQELARVKSQLATSAEGEKRQGSDLNQRLQEKNRELNALQQQLSEQEKSFQTEVARLNQNLEATTKRTEQLAEQLSQQQNEKSSLQFSLLNAENRLALTEKQLVGAKNDLTSVQTTISDKAVQAAKETQEKTEGERRKLEARIAELENEKKKYLDDIQKLQKNTALQDSKSSPVIEIIDPPFVLVRGTPTVTLRSDVKERDIIGKVTADAGVKSLFVNDKKNSLDNRGIFNATLNVNAGRTPVQIVVIDNNGVRESLDFLLEKALDNLGTGSQGETDAVAAKPYATWSNMDIGQFHALIIGNSHYQKISSLDTPINDAHAVEQILRDKYGFKTVTVIDGTRYQILSAMNGLRAKLTDKDNLLIYYGGHGELDKVNMRGHWLPVDADADNDANWISTVSITDILNAMSAKHILVVADTCYSGSMTRAAVGRLEAGMSDEKKLEWVKAMLKAKSRTVLTSGGLKPVMDGGGGDHSVFANAFIKALQTNSGLLEGQELYRSISNNVVAVAANYNVEQVPQYAPVQHAGHEAGEFFFVPK